MATTQHERYWFEDGSVVIRVDNTVFKVHRSVLHLHSPEVFNFYRSEDGTYSVDNDKLILEEPLDGLPTFHLVLDLKAADFGLLLSCIYALE